MKKSRKRYSIAVMISVVVILSPASAGVKPIYGSDDRIEVREADISMCNVATSVAAIFPKTALEPLQNDKWLLDSGTSLRSKNWCETERFVNQNSGAKCTAFLISSEKIVTAGHCINDVADPYGPGLNCHEAVFVFDHKLDRYENLPRTINKNQIYQCSAVVDGTSSMTSIDWRVIELDRETRRQALPVFTGILQPELANPLDIVGHPLGLPMKVARNGQVKSTNSKGFFIADIDSYEGNSGSPVLSEINGRLAVVGVLSSGDIDSDEDTAAQCQYSRRCSSNECTGERATLSSVFSQWATIQHTSPEANWLYTTSENCD